MEHVTNETELEQVDQRSALLTWVKVTNEILWSRIAPNLDWQRYSVGTVDEKAGSDVYYRNAVCLF